MMRCAKVSIGIHIYVKCGSQRGIVRYYRLNHAHKGTMQSEWGLLSDLACAAVTKGARTSVPPPSAAPALVDRTRELHQSLDTLAQVSEHTWDG